MKSARILAVSALIGLVSATALVAAEANSPATALVRGNNTFGFDLYGRVRQRSGNVFFSPLSISTAVAMLSGGARGDTAVQIARTMHFTLAQKDLHPAFEELQFRLKTMDNRTDYQLSMANRLWGQLGRKLLPGYVQLTQRHYGAAAELLDFMGHPEPSRSTINLWIEAQTQRKIKELFPPQSIGPETRLALASAVYFLGNWMRPFAKESTREAPFYTAAGGEVKLPTMHQSGRFRLGAVDGLQLLELPYQGGRLSMNVLLPDRRDGLAKLEASLSAEKLDGWLATLRDRRVNVYLPKFKLQWQAELSEPLKALGMTLPFAKKADFSGIDGTHDLVLSAAVHQALVDVSERGTEASAASGFSSTRSATILKPAEFRADHPFVFLIRDNTTGSILFLGRMAGG